MVMVFFFDQIKVIGEDLESGFAEYPLILKNLHTISK